MKKENSLMTNRNIDRLANIYIEPTNRCDLPNLNGEDCYGNVHPACGGCLWSQGFIQCP